MPRGGLSCSLGNGCGNGCKAVLEVTSTQFANKRVGLICESCARDDYSLRSFLVAVGWVHGWKHLRFKFLGPGREGFLHHLVQEAIDEESSRADEARRDRLDRRIAWATKGFPGIRL